MIQKHVDILKKIKLTPLTVLEIGSRDGNDSNYYKEQFNLNEEDVYIVEPNPIMAEQIRTKYPKYNVLEFAISDVEGIQEFNQVIGGGMDPIGVSSLLDRTDDFYTKYPTNKISVKTLKGSSLLSKIDKEIDICKIDVEGMTYEVIMSLGENIKKIKSFHIETEHHSFWKNQKLHNDVVELMTKLDYKLVWMDKENTLQADSVWIRNDLYFSHVRKLFSDVEIHTLICTKDLLLAINNFKSLQKYEEFFDVPVYLHDDGSLTDSDIETLSVIKNVNIIRRKDADVAILEYIKNHENCLSYRLGDNKINLWHKIKLFDYFYFSKTKKVLGVDTDLLFLRRPENMIEHIINGTPFYFPDVQSAYCFNEPKNEIPVLEKVNTGLIYIPSEEYYNIDDINNALKNLVGSGVNYFPSWIEQSAFAHMFLKNGNYVTLEERKHKIPYFQPVEIEIAECLHFVSYPAVRETYKTYVDYLEFEHGDLIFEKNHIIKYNDQEIPLEYQIKKTGDIYTIIYYWGLEKTSQQFLDHVFKIYADDNIIERKLQSEKTGFFIFTTKSNKIKIEHTYDWFGNTNWTTLDEVQIL